MSAIETIGRGSVRESALVASPRFGYFSLIGVLEWIEFRLEKRRSRIALLEMTDQQLQDIGVSRTEAYRESSRTFWS